MSSFFNKKIIVVTGGTDGIGKALCLYFLQQGAYVATCGRSLEKVNALKKAFEQYPILITQADLTNWDECCHFSEAVINRFKQVDILINNAGISMRGLFEETNLDTLKKVMDINFWGAAYVTKLFLTHIIQQKGSIVNISSIAGYRGLPGRTGYSASKFALTGFTESLRTELLHTGVHVLLACPGFTASNIRQVALNSHGQAQGESPMNEKKMMSADACAKHIATAIEKKKRDLILTGQGKLTVFLNRFLPALSDKLVRNFFYKNNKLIQ